MEHRPAETTHWQPAGEEHFTGQVWFGPMRPALEGDDLNVLGVAFEPGARTDWHHHPGGQTLYVASGAGFVRNSRGETVAIAAGDVVVASPGEVHWHGAAPDSPMMHLSITEGGPTEWLPRKVTDADYDG